MPTPVPVSYSAPAGKRLAAGRTIYPHSLLDLISAVPDGGFVRAGLNTYRSVWPSTDFGPSSGNCRQLIQAWCSVAWDSKRSRLYLWGGGHGNTDYSGMFYWDARTRLWNIGFYSPATMVDPDAPNTAYYKTVDGALISPISAHTYSNNAYLPTLDRFYTPGGAAWNTGGGFSHYDAGLGSMRSIPGYLCQLPLMGKGFVAGLTGNNFKRNGSTVSLPGARAWEALDYFGAGLTVPSVGSASSGGTDVVQEGGVDVVYRITNVVSVKQLWRIALSSLNLSTHSITQVGRVWTGGISNDTPLAIDPVHQIAFMIGASKVEPVVNYARFWDLKTAGPSNGHKTPAWTGADVAEFLATCCYAPKPGCAYDPIRGGIYVYCWGGKVFRVMPPDGNPTPTAGWLVEKVSDETVTRPKTAAELKALGEITGNGDAYSVLGKFRYAPELDSFVILQMMSDGDVWFWKPHGWIDPRGQ